MKIAQIAPVVERVPPHKYGGTERFVYDITEELVKRGHEVTLFASGDSITSAKLNPVVQKHIRSTKTKDIYGANFWTMLNIGVAYDNQFKFDVIHDHNSHLSISTANVSAVPVVMTLHGPFHWENKPLFTQLRRPYLVSISDAQRGPAPDLNYIGTVHHGINVKKFTFSDSHDGYLLYVGRISAEKGVHLAVEAAGYLSLPLIIAAKLDKIDEPYFRKFIKPRLNSKIKWIGEVDDNEKNELMSRAMALLHPVQWREPFGLTMIESMACGAPVVAIRRGSIPEIVVHGKTGYIVEDIEEMIEAITQLDKINRRSCRDHVAANFCVEKMADNYEEIYLKALRKFYKMERERPMLYT